MCRPSILTLAALVWLIPARDALAGQKTQPRAAQPAARSPVRSSPLARAPEPAAKTPIDEFERMTPEEQQEALARLPPAQRKRIEQGLQRFKELPAEQQQVLKNLYSRLHQLPLGEQESVHKAIDRFSKLAPDRQEAVRGEMRGLGSVSSPDRAETLRNGAIRRSFSRKELGIMHDMLPLLPPA